MPGYPSGKVRNNSDQLGIIKRCEITLVVRGSVWFGSAGASIAAGAAGVGGCCCHIGQQDQDLG